MSLELMSLDIAAMDACLPYEIDLLGTPLTFGLRTSNVLNLPGANVEATGRTAERPAFSAKHKKSSSRKPGFRKVNHKRLTERVTESGIVRPSLRDVVRTMFAHREALYGSFSTLVRELRQQPPLLPPSHHLTSHMTIFPSMFSSPTSMPTAMQAWFSEYRFFFAKSCIYHRRLGQVLYIMPRAWFAAGHLGELFSPQKGNRCEMFWRDSVTRHFHYLGVFQLVNSELFPYNFTVCGNVPELNEVEVKPMRGRDEAPYAFVALQYVGWNSTVYEACLPAPVQTTD